MDINLQNIKKMEKMRDNAYNLSFNYKRLIELIYYHNINVGYYPTGDYRLSYKNKLLMNIMIKNDNYFISELFSNREQSEHVGFQQLRAYIEIWVRMIDIREKIKENK